LNIPSLNQEQANSVADAINNCFSPDNRRYWKVVKDDYKLQPGFEP